MSLFPELLARNDAFVASRPESAGQMPSELSYVICCVDPRVEPAAVLGVGLNDALVQRNPGGRVTDEVVSDVALLSFMGDFMGLGTGALEVAVIHHTGCGMGLLAVPEFATAYAARAEVPLEQARARAVTEPDVTVAADVQRILQSPHVSPRVVVSGHVLDLDTGRIRTVVPATPVLAAAAARLGTSA